MTKQVTYEATRVVTAGDGPCVIVNRDLANSCYWSDSNTISPDNPATYSILDPLGAIPVSGNSDIYLCTPNSGTTVTVDVIRKGLNWAPSPVLQAEQIVANGVPLVRNSNVVLNAANVTIAPNTTIIFQESSLSQMTLQLALNLAYESANGTIPFIVCEFVWEATGLGNIRTDEIVLTVAAYNSTACTYSVTTPVYGEILSIYVTNLDAAESVQLYYSATESSNLTSKLEVQQGDTVTSVPGFNIPAVNPLRGNLGSSNNNVNAGKNSSRLAKIWNGKAQLTVDNTGGGSNAIYVALQDPEGSSANSLYSMAGSATIAGMNVGGGDLETLAVSLPNGPVLIFVQNNGAASVTPSIALTRTNE